MGRLSYEEQQRIEAEERHRHRTRQELFARDAQNEQNRLQSEANLRAYIEQHGSEGAAKLTLMKWTIAGVVFGIFGVIGSLDGSGGIKEAFGNFVMCVLIFAVIGLYRASKMRG